MIAVPRGDALCKALLPRRKHAHFRLVGVRHGKLRLFEAGKQPPVLLEHFLHRAVHGGVCGESARLFEVAEREIALADHRAAVRHKFARQQF